jgi:hypothetical protein
VSGAQPQEALLACIVGCLLPAFPELPAAERAAVAGDVIAQVGAQIAAMPRFLRLPYRSALAAFDLLCVLRYGRPFRALDEVRQRAWVAAWDERGVGATRAVMKLVRSCTLFAWYDHPRVGPALLAAAR